MTDKEKAIRWFENIAYACDKLTSGNVAHLKVQIKGMAIRSAEYLTKHSQEPASDDLEEASRNYADDEEYGDDVYFSIKATFKAGAQWQREQVQLTWQDMHTIAIIEDKLIHELCINDQTLPQTQEFYQEVLKRFKAKRYEARG